VDWLANQLDDCMSDRTLMLWYCQPCTAPYCRLVVLHCACVAGFSCCSRAKRSGHWKNSFLMSSNTVTVVHFSVVEIYIVM